MQYAAYVRCLDALKQREINFRNLEAQMKPENLQEWQLLKEDPCRKNKEVISVHIARLKKGK